MDACLLLFRICFWYFLNTFLEGFWDKFLMDLGTICCALWGWLLRLFLRTSMSWFLLPFSCKAKLFEVLRHHFLILFSLIFWCFFEVGIFTDCSSILEPCWEGLGSHFRYLWCNFSRSFLRSKKGGIANVNVCTFRARTLARGTLTKVRVPS